MLSHTELNLHESTTYYVASFVYQFYFQNRSTADSFFVETFCLVQTSFRVIAHNPFLLVSSSRTACDIVIRSSYRELV